MKRVAIFEYLKLCMDLIRVKGMIIMIPISNPKSQFSVIKDEVLDRFSEVLLSGNYIMGPSVGQLEREVANKLEVSEAIAVANGTDALVLALHALDIGAGDEVITTPFTFFATAEAISRVGATPVFVDIDKETFNIDPEKIESEVTNKTKAILPVHLFGQPAAMDEINLIAKKHRLMVIEDACQAFGASYKGRKVGSLGDVACFSFFPTKNLSTMGDGGIITTSDKELADRIKSLRTHGSEKKYFHQEIGYNSRLDEIHAAILLVCLKYIDNWNKKRIALANRYINKLRPLTYLKLPHKLENVSHVYHLFSLQTEYRDQLIHYLHHKNIQAGTYYPCPLHLQKAYTHLAYKEGDLPVAEKVSKRILSIPIFPYLSDQEQAEIIEALFQFKERGS